MSIVNEALKKASRNPSGMPVSKEIIREALSLPETKPASGIWGSLFVLIVIFGVSIPLWLPSIQNRFLHYRLSRPPASPLASYHTPDSSPTTGESPINSSTARGKFSVEEQNLPAEESTPSPVTEQPLFSLQGIAYDGPASVALINDRMVSVGQQIEGAKVEEIRSDRVQLNHDGEKITLRLR